MHGSAGCPLEVRACQVGEALRFADGETTQANDVRAEDGTRVGDGEVSELAVEIRHGGDAAGQRGHDRLCPLDDGEHDGAEQLLLVTEVVVDRSLRYLSGGRD